MSSTDLSDAQWRAIQPHLPPPNRRGRPRADDRRVVNGILFILRAGCRWQDLPRQYAHPTTCWRRLAQWQQNGTWTRIWHTLLAVLAANTKLAWARVYLDGTFIPAKRGGAAVGLTRRGKGSKLMLAVEGNGLPLGVLVASAQKAEVHLAEATLATIRIPCGRGRPRTRPQEVVADRGYDSEPLRVRLRARGIRPCIPRRRNARPRRGPKPNLAGYRSRWHIERTVAWLGNYRRILVRYERQPQIYHSFVVLACILICLKRVLQ